MAFYQLRKEQLVRTSLDDLWAFISAPQNLQEITPDSMGFVITSDETPREMYPGCIITYKVKPLMGIPMKWMTEITHVEDRKFFVDEQRVGPYKLWHHQHILEEREDGILMKDIVTYEPPFGFLGRIANGILIRRKLNQIFDYRFKVLEERFH